MSRLHELAFKLADETARSDIECECVGMPDSGFKLKNADYDARSLQVIADALEYLTLRGADLPFRVSRKGNIVRFVDKEEA